MLRLKFEAFGSDENTREKFEANFMLGSVALLLLMSSQCYRGCPQIEMGGSSHAISVSRRWGPLTQACVVRL
jgi:hypothetical protein